MVFPPLDTQGKGNVDVDVAAIKERTDNLPDDPADNSEILDAIGDLNITGFGTLKLPSEPQQITLNIGAGVVDLGTVAIPTDIIPDGMEIVAIRADLEIETAISSYAALADNYVYATTYLQFKNGVGGTWRNLVKLPAQSLYVRKQTSSTSTYIDTSAGPKKLSGQYFVKKATEPLAEGDTLYLQFDANCRANQATLILNGLQTIITLILGPTS